MIVSLARSRSSLALGNVVGSAISNILGAFSLGLLTQSTADSIRFDRSSRIYSLLLLLLTTFATPVTYFAQKRIWKPAGGTLIVSFAIYVASIVWAISQGKVTAPEASDDESGSSDSESETADEVRPLLGAENPASDSNEAVSPRQERPSAATPRRLHSLQYHIVYLIIGFLAISLAAYILSNAATNIIDQLGISDILFGVIFLAIATTLPEKFIAVFSGSRGHQGILVANTAGSNIFLLSLCLGIIMVDTHGRLDADNVNVAELAVMWGSTVVFTATVWFGGRWSKWIGTAMLAAYIAFLVLEFTVIRRV